MLKCQTWLSRGGIVGIVMSSSAWFTRCDASTGVASISKHACNSSLHADSHLAARAAHPYVHACSRLLANEAAVEAVHTYFCLSGHKQISLSVLL